MKILAWVRQLPCKALMIIAIALALIGLALIYHATAQVVVIVVDGQPFDLRTHARTVGAALHAAGFDPALEDRVSPPMESGLRAGTTIRLDRAYPVNIELEGEIQTVYTPETTPANILTAADVRLYPGDRLWVDGRRLIDSTEVLNIRPSRIRVERAVAITLEQDGAIQVIHSAAPTLGEALWEAGVVVLESDRLIPDPESPITTVSRAVLNRSRSLLIEVDGNLVITRAVGPTVGEALAEASIALVGFDYTEPGVNNLIPADGTIRVVRVREEVQVELEPLPIKTVYQSAPDVEIDNYKVLDAGTYGVLASWIRIRRENSEEVDRIVEDQVEIMEPQPRVIGYGTKIIVRTLNTPSGPVEYWRAVSMYATAYSPCHSAADRCYYHTSSGKLVQQGVVAFVLRWYLDMKGWPVYIPGYGHATVEDVGGGIPGRYWIDLGYSDDDIVSWNQWVTVYFLTPVPQADAIPWILD